MYGAQGVVATLRCMTAVRVPSSLLAGCASVQHRIVVLVNLSTLAHKCTGDTLLLIPVKEGIHHAFRVVCTGGSDGGDDGEATAVAESNGGAATEAEATLAVAQASDPKAQATTTTATTTTTASNAPATTTTDTAATNKATAAAKKADKGKGPASASRFDAFVQENQELLEVSTRSTNTFSRLPPCLCSCRTAPEPPSLTFRTFRVCTRVRDRHTPQLTPQRNSHHHIQLL